MRQAKMEMLAKVFILLYLILYTILMNVKFPSYSRLWLNICIVNINNKQINFIKIIKTRDSIETLIVYELRIVSCIVLYVSYSTLEL